MSKYKPATMHEKQERIIHCNRLIKMIASYGCKFFYCDGDIAVLMLTANGRVYLFDEYTKELINTHNTRGHWPGFSNGGTLQRLVCSMRDYVIKGKHLNIKSICCPGFYTDGGNVWGYPPEEAEKLINAVKSNPIFGEPSNV
ncbi:hypothetical protein VXS06_14690 [Photobacterium toruni]|uniref:Uncharacterized protein n=1 Tax=Photobacterium toruni TaxID=1935446 RepID=A0ABU6LAF5_9GAMM|nr:hypothetical protein [Photobacterium toruni]